MDDKLNADFCPQYRIDIELLFFLQLPNSFRITLPSPLLGNSSQRATNKQADRQVACETTIFHTKESQKSQHYVYLIVNLKTRYLKSIIKYLQI